MLSIEKRNTYNQQGNQWRNRQRLRKKGREPSGRTVMRAVQRENTAIIMKRTLQNTPTRYI